MTQDVIDAEQLTCHGLLRLSDVAVGGGLAGADLAAEVVLEAGS